MQRKASGIIYFSDEIFISDFDLVDTTGNTETKRCGNNSVENIHVAKYRSMYTQLAKNLNRTVPEVLLETRDARGFSQLDLAARHGTLSVIEYIADHQPALIDRVGNSGCTALHWSARASNPAAVAFLLKASEPEARYRLNAHGESPMLLSLDAVHAANFEVLFQGAHWDEVKYLFCTFVSEKRVLCIHTYMNALIHNFVTHTQFTYSFTKNIVWSAIG